MVSGNAGKHHTTMSALVSPSLSLLLDMSSDILACTALGCRGFLCCDAPSTCLNLKCVCGRTLTGLGMLVCSMDGTVAYLDFSLDELGDPLSEEEKVSCTSCRWSDSMCSLLFNLMQRSFLHCPQIIPSSVCASTNPTWMFQRWPLL